MANRKHVAKLKEGREAWNAWRRATYDKADLSSIHLIGHLLDFYELTEVDLSHSRLEGVTFRGTYCSAVSFERAFIFDAIFRSAPMSQCCFREADIRTTPFDWCRLEKIDFTNSTFDGNA